MTGQADDEEPESTCDERDSDDSDENEESDETEGTRDRREQRKESLKEMLQATSHETGSFHGKKRPQAKWLKKDQEKMAEVDELAMEIWEETEMESMWDLNRLTYAAATVLTAAMDNVSTNKQQTHTHEPPPPPPPPIPPSR